MERAEYVWNPCAGAKYVVPIREVGHTGSISLSGDINQEVVGWMTKEEATENYPGLIISGSSAHCPDCSRDWRDPANS